MKTSKGLNGTYKDYFNYGEVVCSGYADLYMYLCDGIGISCRQVTSTAMNHRWNQVQIDGIWYNVDVCWMDSATDGKYSLQYFLVSLSNSRGGDTISKIGIYTDDNNVDHLIWIGCVVTSDEEMVKKQCPTAEIIRENL